MAKIDLMDVAVVGVALFAVSSLFGGGKIFASADFDKVMYKGETGPEVKELQRIVNKEFPDGVILPSPYYVPENSPEFGKFGQQLSDAIDVIAERALMETAGTFNYSVNSILNEWNNQKGISINNLKSLLSV